MDVQFCVKLSLNKAIMLFLGCEAQRRLSLHHIFLRFAIKCFLWEMETFENHVRPQRSISSPLHHLCTICKGYCQVVVTSISGSPRKGHLHFCLSSGLDYCNSLLTALHNRALHSLQQAQPPALVFVRKGWFEHIVLIVKPFHQWQQSQWIDHKIVLFT